MKPPQPHRLDESQAVPTPREIVERLSRFVVGQERAKRALAIAAYNHLKRTALRRTRRQVPIRKSNVLLIGPTGCGKTHLARTLAQILDVPFHVADATEFTEAVYYGPATRRSRWTRPTCSSCAPARSATCSPTRRRGAASASAPATAAAGGAPDPAEGPPRVRDARRVPRAAAGRGPAGRALAGGAPRRPHRSPRRDRARGEGAALGRRRWVRRRVERLASM